MSHPEIGLLVHMQKEIYLILYGSNYQPLEALDKMRGLHDGLESKHQDDSFEQTLDHEIKLLEQKQRRSQQYKTYVLKKKREYQTHYKKLVNLLWTHGYLFNKRYGGPIIDDDGVTFG